MVRVRFAPSPTGDLHIGSARTALFNFLFALNQKGKFILRIEDTDRTRSTTEFEKSIVSDLKWLGIKWDEGPEIGGSYGPYRQSEKLEKYIIRADELVSSGYAYQCFCLPNELEEMRDKALAEGEMPKYDGRCRSLTDKDRESFLAEGRKPAIRFKVKSGKIFFKDLVRGYIEFDSSVIGDFIILRSDKTASYHFAVVVDDLDMEITHVIRGEDHLTNTARHIRLFQALSSKPPEFAHIPMIMGSDGNKLSKRHGSTAIHQFRKEGYLPQALTNYLSLLSWSMSDGRDIFSMEEAGKEFSLNRVSKSSAIFDYSKLIWINEQYLHKLTTEQFIEKAKPYLIDLDFIKDQEISADNPRFREMIEAIQSHVKVFSEVGENLKIFFEPLVEKISDWKKGIPEDIKEILSEDVAEEILNTLKQKISKSEKLDKEISRMILKELGTEYGQRGVKGKNLYMPIRISLTGRTAGPEIYHLLSIFGREEALQRIDLILNYLNAD